MYLSKKLVPPLRLVGLLPVPELPTRFERLSKASVATPNDGFHQRKVAIKVMLKDVL